MGAWTWFWSGFAVGVASSMAVVATAFGGVRLWQRRALRDCADIDARR